MFGEYLLESEYIGAFFQFLLEGFRKAPYPDSDFTIEVKGTRRLYGKLADGMVGNGMVVFLRTGQPVGGLHDEALIGKYPALSVQLECGLDGFSGEEQGCKFCFDDSRVDAAGMTHEIR